MRRRDANKFGTSLLRLSATLRSDCRPRRTQGSRKSSEISVFLQASTYKRVYQESLGPGSQAFACGMRGSRTALRAVCNKNATLLHYPREQAEKQGKEKMQRRKAWDMNQRKTVRWISTAVMLGITAFSAGLVSAAGDPVSDWNMVAVQA